MSKQGFLVIVTIICIGSLIGCHSRSCCQPKAGQELMLAHNVYFILLPIEFSRFYTAGM